MPMLPNRDITVQCQRGESIMRGGIKETSWRQNWLGDFGLSSLIAGNKVGCKHHPSMFPNSLSQNCCIFTVGFFIWLEHDIEGNGPDTITSKDIQQLRMKPPIPCAIVRLTQDTVGNV